MPNIKCGLTNRLKANHCRMKIIAQTPERGMLLLGSPGEQLGL